MVSSYLLMSFRNGIIKIKLFFCDDPDCDIVYFGEDGSIILKSLLCSDVSLNKTVVLRSFLKKHLNLKKFEVSLFHRSKTKPARLVFHRAAVVLMI